MIIKTWFKVTAQPLPKGTLLVKYEPDWAKGKENNLRKMISNGQPEGQTDHRRSPAKRAPNYRTNVILQMRLFLSI